MIGSGVAVGVDVETGDLRLGADAWGVQAENRRAMISRMKRGDCFVVTTCGFFIRR